MDASSTDSTDRHRQGHQVVQGDQLKDAHRDGHAAGKYPHEVTEARPGNGDHGLQRLGIDDRRYGVGRIVKSVYKFKPDYTQEA